MIMPSVHRQGAGNLRNHRPTFAHRLQYGLFLALQALVGIVPWWLARALGRAVGRLYYRIDADIVVHCFVTTGNDVPVDFCLILQMQHFCHIQYVGQVGRNAIIGIVFFSIILGRHFYRSVNRLFQNLDLLWIMWLLPK